MSVPTPIRVLILEDNPSDADLIVDALRQAGFDPAWERVETQAAFADRLNGELDLILSDYTLPQFNGVQALRLVRSRALDVPFILISGSIGEDIAVEAMREGADDYLLKDRMGRLGPAVLKALEERRLRTQRDRAESARRESDARFRQMAENIHEVFYLTNATSTEILYISPAYESVWGRSCASLCARPESWIEAIHPDDRPRVTESFQKALIAGHFEFEFRIVRPDGSIRWIYDRGFPIRDDRGALHRITGIAEDITERKQAEQSLAERAQLAALQADIGLALTRGDTLGETLQLCCESIVQHMHAAFARVWTLNEAGGMLELQASAGMYTHLDGAHGRVPVGKFKIGLIAQERKPHLTNQVVGDPRVSDQEWARREGMVAFAGYPLLVADHLVGVVAMFARCTLTDMALQGLASIANTIALGTERKRAADALRESERRFSDMLGKVELVSLMLDREARIIYCNDYLLRLTGWTREEVLGQSWFDLFIPHDMDQLKNVFADLIADLPHTWHHENEILTRSGARRLVRWNNSVLRSVSGDVIGTASIGEDITEHKRNEEALRQSEYRLDLALEASSFATWEWNFATGEVRFSRHWWPILGYKPDEVPLRIEAWENLTHPEDLARVKSMLAAVIKGSRAVLDVEYRMCAKNREMRWIRSVGRVIERNAADRALRMTGTHADITTRKEQEHRIARLSRIQAVLSGINSAIVRIRDREELFEEACRIAVEHGGFSIGWIALLDRASGTLLPVAKAGLTVDLGVDGNSSNRSAGLVPGGTAAVALREKRAAFDNDIERGLGEMGDEVGSDTLSVRREAIRLGAKSVVVLPLFVEGQTFGVLTLYAPEPNFFDGEELKLLNELAGDISFGLEFMAKEEKVDYLAYYDSLTGLPNRSLFFDRLTHQLGSAARERLNVVLALMDMDRFRMVNDSLGRQAGDALLGTFAQRIKGTFRDQDTLARIGADSFAVAVSGTWGATDAARVLEAHNRKLFGQPFLIGNEELRVSATFGVAVFPGDGNSPETLFANAEAALKKAKSSGEHLLFYGPEMNARVADSLRLENRLRRALENGEMVLWYQPKVSVSTREITGFEALMRWQDPETGMVPPAKFIPLMEQTGLILDAGRWALSQVARDCGLWKASGFKPPRVAVNVSPLQLRQKDFVATVVDAAEKTEAAGSMLDLEITESVIMENVDAIIPMLQTVRGLGVEIAVDDFGTGYSSLAYIARLPIHDLKIDRSFIAGMSQRGDSLTIVKSVISLAHSLRLNVVAEGVETEEQAALLLELGCDQMQGYLFSRPVPPKDIPELLRKQGPSADDKPAKNASTPGTRNPGARKNRKRP